MLVRDKSTSTEPGFPRPARTRWRSSSATEEVFAMIPEGTPQDVDKAVQAVAAAFPGWAATSARSGPSGSPYRRGPGSLHRRDRPGHIAPGRHVHDLWDPFRWACRPAPSSTPPRPPKVSKWKEKGSGTPWSCASPWASWVPSRRGTPAVPVVLKVAPAIAAGCTVVLKPSEAAPINALILADVIDEAGLRRASSTSSAASAPWSARRSLTEGGHGVLHRLHPGGRRVMELAAEGIKRVSSSWAASRPTSSSTTPTSPPPPGRALRPLHELGPDVLGPHRRRPAGQAGRGGGDGGGDRGLRPW